MYVKFLTFCSQLPDATAQEAFAQSQLYVWAITGERGNTCLSPVETCVVLAGLAHLSAASYTEDTYGVVQKVSE